MNITPPCIPWYFPMNESMNTRICDPWEARKFRNLMENIPDGQCDKCLPDCSTTLYHASVTAAPFRRCDYKNLGISYLCNFDEKIDPPIWGQQVLDQYFNDLNVDDSSLLPDYIRSGVKTQHRRYAGPYTNQASILLENKHSYYSFAFRRKHCGRKPSLSSYKYQIAQL